MAKFTVNQLAKSLSFINNLYDDERNKPNVVPD